MTLGKGCLAHLVNFNDAKKLGYYAIPTVNQLAEIYVQLLISGNSLQFCISRDNL